MYLLTVHQSVLLVHQPDDRAALVWGEEFCRSPEGDSGDGRAQTARAVLPLPHPQPEHAGERVNAGDVVLRDHRGRAGGRAAGRAHQAAPPGAPRHAGDAAGLAAQRGAEPAVRTRGLVGAAAHRGVLLGPEERRVAAVFAEGVLGGSHPALSLQRKNGVTCS